MFGRSKETIVDSVVKDEPTYPRAITLYSAPDKSTFLHEEQCAEYINIVDALRAYGEKWMPPEERLAVAYISNYLSPRVYRPSYTDKIKTL